MFFIEFNARAEIELQLNRIKLPNVRLDRAGEFLLPKSNSFVTKMTSS